jgi:hypothetical protein
MLFPPSLGCAAEDVESTEYTVRVAAALRSAGVTAARLICARKGYEPLECHAT